MNIVKISPIRFKDFRSCFLYKHKFNISIVRFESLIEPYYDEHFCVISSTSPLLSKYDNYTVSQLYVNRDGVLCFDLIEPGDLE